MYLCSYQMFWVSPSFPGKHLYSGNEKCNIDPFTLSLLVTKRMGNERWINLNPSSPSKVTRTKPCLAKGGLTLLGPKQKTVCSLFRKTQDMKNSLSLSLEIFLLIKLLFTVLFMLFSLEYLKTNSAIFWFYSPLQ